MTLLLCSECCQWREPVDGRCPVCAGTLDLAVPDPSLESIAEEIGDLQSLLGDAEVSHALLVKRGELWVTTHGLLFVPHESRVIVFSAQPLSPLALLGRGVGGEGRCADGAGEGNEHRHSGWLFQFWAWLTRRSSVPRFACERRSSDLTSLSRLALAELLRSDPGVLFWSRGAIATWRRQRGQWELIRRDSHSWPERIAMRDRDGDRVLQTWLETTECPLPVNAR